VRDDPDHPPASDRRTTEELIAAALDASRPDNEARWGAIHTLHFRGSRAELDAALALTRSPSAEARSTAAHILGQLGQEDRTFLDESVDALIALLDDPSPDVISDAAVALGHRGDPRADAALLERRTHPDPEVRFGVAFGLSGLAEPATLLGLIGLSRDPDRDVRDWATFQLAQQSEADTPAMREAFVARLDDEDAEVRGEALVGLAKRKDARVIAALRREFERPQTTDLPLEAAAAIADPSLVPVLEGWWIRLGADQQGFFGHRYSLAIAACSDTTC
jgi:HEAT repeat protein